MQIKRWFLNNSLRNYQYLLYDKQYAIVVDPLKHNIFDDFIKKNKLSLEAILITHRHGDHIAGVKKILALYPNAKVYAYGDNDLFKPDVYVKDGDFINLGFTSFRVIYTPGHINDHVCFLFDEEKSLFCGDTIFNAGVGNIKSESADINQLYNSLIKIVSLDNNIKLYPAHDYWLSNLDFALSILPDDSYLNDYRDKIVNLPAEDKPITTLSEESKINIFIRSLTDKKLLQALPNYQLGQEMFVKLRQLKDKF
ncbi:MAG: MBL fold metallo-hydrolase [Francisella sp.]